MTLKLQTDRIHQYVSVINKQIISHTAVLWTSYHSVFDPRNQNQNQALTWTSFRLELNARWYLSAGARKRSVNTVGEQQRVQRFNDTNEEECFLFSDSIIDGLGVLILTIVGFFSQWIHGSVEKLVQKQHFMYSLSADGMKQLNVLSLIRYY